MLVLRPRSSHFPRALESSTAVRQASRELFSQNEDQGALRLSKSHSEELLKTKSSWGGRNPSQRAPVMDLDKTHLFASGDVPSHVIGCDLGCVRSIL